MSHNKKKPAKFNRRFFYAPYLRDALSDGDWVCEYSRDEPLEGLDDPVLAGIGSAGEVPPGVDVLGVLGQGLPDLLMHLPPVKSVHDFYIFCFSKVGTLCQNLP